MRFNVFLRPTIDKVNDTVSDAISGKSGLDCNLFLRLMLSKKGETVSEAKLGKVGEIVTCF